MVHAFHCRPQQVSINTMHVRLIFFPFAICGNSCWNSIDSFSPYSNPYTATCLQLPEIGGLILGWLQLFSASKYWSHAKNNFCHFLLFFCYLHPYIPGAGLLPLFSPPFALHCSQIAQYFDQNWSHENFQCIIFASYFKSRLPAAYFVTPCCLNFILNFAIENLRAF